MAAQLFWQLCWRLSSSTSSLLWDTSSSRTTLFWLWTGYPTKLSVSWNTGFLPFPCWNQNACHALPRCQNAWNVFPHSFWITKKKPKMKNIKCGGSLYIHLLLASSYTITIRRHKNECLTLKCEPCIVWILAWFLPFPTEQSMEPAWWESSSLVEFVRKKMEKTAQQRPRWMVGWQSER